MHNGGKGSSKVNKGKLKFSPKHPNGKNNGRENISNTLSDFSKHRYTISNEWLGLCSGD